MDFLEKDEIDLYIRSLEAAREAGNFSISGSPIKPMLLSLIDLCILISRAFQEGRSLTGFLNTYPEFDDSFVKDDNYYKYGIKRGNFDPLGNIPSKTVHTRAEIKCKSKAKSLWFDSLGQLLSNLLRVLETKEREFVLPNLKPNPRKPASPRKIEKGTSLQKKHSYRRRRRRRH